MCAKVCADLRVYNFNNNRKRVPIQTLLARVLLPSVSTSSEASRTGPITEGVKDFMHGNHTLDP